MRFACRAVARFGSTCCHVLCVARFALPAQAYLQHINTLAATRTNLSLPAFLACLPLPQHLPARHRNLTTEHIKADESADAGTDGRRGVTASKYLLFARLVW